MSYYLCHRAKPIYVPEITDEEIAEMLHIQPLLRVPDTSWYRRIKDQSRDPRSDTFLWDAEPTGRRLAFHPLDRVEIITYHTFGAPSFFKPTLSEVYGAIRQYVPKDWLKIKFFCLDSENLGAQNIIGDCHFCRCYLFGEPAARESMSRDEMVELLRSTFREATAVGYRPPTTDEATNYANFVASELRRMFQENPAKAIMTLEDVEAFASELESGGLHNELVELINEAQKGESCSE